MEMSLLHLSVLLMTRQQCIYANSMIIEHLKTQHQFNKIIVFSDGAKQHFKNRFNIHNVLNYEKDFGVKTEWHFYATAHGKGPHDGATLKVHTRKASLQASSSNSILDAKKLYDWATKNLQNITFFYYTKKQHNAMLKTLQKRFRKNYPIPHIQVNHCFIPISNTKLLIKRFSNDEEGLIHEITGTNSNVSKI